MLTTVVSVLFSGVVAAYLTHRLNRRSAKEDARERNGFLEQSAKNQQFILEDWELRKYEANLRLYFFRTLTELFYSYKNEIHYLGIDLANAEAIFRGAEHGTEQFLLQNDPNITVTDLAEKKQILLAQQFEQLLNRKNARIDQYNSSTKALLAKAEAEISICSHYISPNLLEQIRRFVDRLNTETSLYTPENVQTRLGMICACEEEFRQIQQRLLGETQTFVKALAANA